MTTLDDMEAANTVVVSVKEARQVLTDASGHAPDERTIRRACSEGHLPSIRLGRRVYILREPFLALLRDGEVKVK